MISLSIDEPEPNFFHVVWLGVVPGLNGDKHDYPTLNYFPVSALGGDFLEQQPSPRVFTTLLFTLYSLLIHTFDTMLLYNDIISDDELCSDSFDP